MKRLIGCYTTRGYRLYLKSFKENSLVGIMKINYQGILVLIKRDNSLIRNIINQFSGKMLKSIGCNICLALKLIQYKLYSNFQLLLISTYRWKDFLRNFIIGLPISIDWKDNNYDPILVIIDRQKKIIYYGLVKVTINASGLAKVILEIVVWYHGLFNSVCL